MPLDARELDQRLRKLRKSLNGFSKSPTADEVHDLRTRTRRVESILQSLEMDSAANERKLLGELKPIRSRAGKVRDMDVLTSYVVGLGLKDDPDCVVRLVHHLGMERHRHGGKLYSTVRKSAPELDRRLKRTRRRMDSVVDRFVKAKFDLESKGDRQHEKPLHAMSVALRLSKELAAVPRLGPNNLHAYRLEVKRLRYVLEMPDTEGGRSKAFIEALRLVQDSIGEWHDWIELSNIAHEVLQQHRGCEIVRKIEQIAHRKYSAALRITEKMRHRYLLPPGNKPRQRRQISGPVLVATSEIAA